MQDPLQYQTLWELILYALISGILTAAAGFFTADRLQKPLMPGAIIGGIAGILFTLALALTGADLKNSFFEAAIYTIFWVVIGGVIGWKVNQLPIVGAIIGVIVGYSIIAFNISIPIENLFDRFIIGEIIAYMGLWGVVFAMPGFILGDMLGSNPRRGAAFGFGLGAGLWVGFNLLKLDMNLIFLEIILFTIAWGSVIGLAGFYSFMVSNHNPRMGAAVGWIIGAIAGHLLLGTGIADSVQEMANIIAIVWTLALMGGLIASAFPQIQGHYAQRETQRITQANMAYALILPTFVIVFAIVVFPMIWNLVLGFRDVRVADLRTIQLFSLQSLNLDNFTSIFRRSETFFEVFWGVAGYTIMFLLVMLAGWQAGKRISTRMNYEPDGYTGGWMGLLFALILIIAVANRQEYFAALGDLLNGRLFIITLMRSLVYTLLGTILVITFGLIAALVVKDSFPGRNIVRGFLLFPYIAPIVSVVLVWKMLLSPQFGIINNGLEEIGIQSTDYLGTNGVAFIMIVLFQAWRYFPFAFLFILARIQAIPDDIYEAAKVDGASPSQRLLYVTLPQLRAVFGTLFLLRFIWTFNKFDDVYLLTGGAANTQLVPIEIQFQLFSRDNVGTASAIALVLALVLFVVVAVYFRWFYVEER